MSKNTQMNQFLSWLAGSTHGSSKKFNSSATSKFRANASQAVPSTTTVSTSSCETLGGSGTQTAPILSGNPNWNQYTCVVTGIQFAPSGGQNGIAGLYCVYFCKIESVGTNPKQYSATAQWGVGGGGWTITMMAPLGYAVSGLGWSTGNPAGILGAVLKYSHIYTPGVATRQPDQIQYLWDACNGQCGTWNGTGSLTSADVKGGTQVQCCTSTVPTVTAPSQSMSTKFLSNFTLCWYPDNSFCWQCGLKAINSVTYLDITPFLNMIYSSSGSQLQAGCCLGLYANDDLYTTACNVLNLTNSSGTLSSGCTATVNTYCGSNITDTNCQSFLIDNQGSQWDSLVNNACGQTTNQSNSSSSAFCSCSTPMTFDSSVPASLQTVLQSQPQCANPTCSQKGYKNSTARQSCTLNILSCLNETNINSGSTVSSQISVSPSSNCQQQVSQTDNNTTNNTPTPSPSPSSSPSAGSSPSPSPSPSSSPASSPSSSPTSSPSSSSSSSSSSLSTNEIIGIVVGVLVFVFILIAVIVWASSGSSSSSSKPPATVPAVPISAPLPSAVPYLPPYPYNYPQPAPMPVYR